MSMMDTNDTASSAAPISRDPARDRSGAFGSTEAAATARQVGLLERLADAGMELARAAGLRATAPVGADEAAGITEQAIAFGQVARAVRQAIGLEVKLRADRRAGEYDPATAAAIERQLRLLQELAEISFAVAKGPANPVAVPIFLRVARAVRQTIEIGANLRSGKRTLKGRAASPPPPQPAEPAASPGEDESEAEPVGGSSGDVATALAETLDAFNEYYRFLRVPVADAVAQIFKTLGVPVEPGPGPAEAQCEPDPVSVPAATASMAAAAPAGTAASIAAARLEPGRPGGGNRGPP
jgi:hypothetical protein